MTNYQLNAMFDALSKQIEKNQQLAKATPHNEVFIIYHTINGVLLALNEALIAAVKTSSPEEEGRSYEGK